MGLSPSSLASPSRPRDISYPLSHQAAFNCRLATRARQLESHESDLASIRDNVIKSRLASVHQLKRQYENPLLAYDFKPSDLVLVRNSSAESDIGRKTKPRYIGPMVVPRRSLNGAYHLAELMERYLSFATRHLHRPLFFSLTNLHPVTQVLDRDDLTVVVQDLADDDADSDEDEA